jgi:two-component system, cell cycle sensor histidine kinase and response regulator CckA
VPEPGRDGSLNGDAAEADPRVLGQLLAAQSVLFVLPGAEQIGAFFAEALAVVPGVESVVVCLEGVRSPSGSMRDACAECPIRRDVHERPAVPTRSKCGLATDPPSRSIRVGTAEQVFGFVVVRTDTTRRCEPYWPFLENLAAHLALALENRAHKRLLEHARDELEQRVDERTRDLREANEALVLSRRQAIDAMHEAIDARLHAERANADMQREITERTRAEAALRASEERYRRITETVTDYVYTVQLGGTGDLEGAATSHGPGCVAVTGYTSEELEGDPGLWLAIVGPQARAAVVEQVHSVLAGRKRAPVEHQITRKDGVVRWVRHTQVPHVDTDGNLVAYDGLIQDITEERALREQLIHAQKMEGVGRLAGGVAHDFNNLLTAIVGNVSLARLDMPSTVPEDHAIRTDLEEIRKAGERAAALTRQLLAFASRQPIEPARLDLSAVVADSLRMLRRLLGEDIEIVTALSPDLGPTEVDPGQIQQLLVNLAVNARDAMPDGGRLTIETRDETIRESNGTAPRELTPGRYVRLSVSDTGTGMTPDVRAHLFEPFFTTKEPGKGTGLGLSICHGIVRQAGGAIEVATDPGRGTRFTVLLPQTDGAPIAPRAAANDAIPRGRETVVVVEDEASVRRIAVLALRAHGYRVHEVASAEAALDLLARLRPPPDAIVTDVVMPGMSGPQLAALVLERYPGIRILLVSGHAETAIMPRDVRQTGLPFLPKPYTPERLARRLREVLDARAPHPGPPAAAGPDAPTVEQAV